MVRRFKDYQGDPSIDARPLRSTPVLNRMPTLKLEAALHTYGCSPNMMHAVNKAIHGGSSVWYQECAVYECSTSRAISSLLRVYFPLIASQRHKCAGLEQEANQDALTVVSL